MIFVFVVCSWRPCAVVAVVKSSCMVVLRLSELMMRRNLTLERFVSRSCSPWLPLFHFSVSGLMMYCKS